MKKRILTCFLIHAIYIFILSVGIFVIFYMQHHLHSSLKEDATNAASELSTYNALINDYRYPNNSIFIATTEGFSALYANNSQAFLKIKSFAEKYAVTHNSPNITYSIVFDRNTLSFFAIATAPITREGRYIGTLYIVHAVRYLLSVFITFFVLYTFVFLCVLACIHIFRRSNERVTNIYRQYVANVSHEIKTPISSIQALVETLSEGLVTDEATISRYYAIITRESRHLEHSVLEIIELSKMQDRRTDFSKEITDINTILCPILDKFQDRCEEIDITLTPDDSLFQLPPLFTNVDLIIRLLDLLLDNAIKFVDFKGEIRIWASSNTRRATICITDDGCGIHPEDLPHIFERFYIGKECKNTTGSGLGLAIAKEITSGLEENIWAKSEYGKGTSFYFTLQFPYKFAFPNLKKNNRKE